LPVLIWHLLRDRWDPQRLAVGCWHVLHVVVFKKHAMWKPLIYHFLWNQFMLIVGMIYYGLLLGLCLQARARECIYLSDAIWLSIYYVLLIYPLGHVCFPWTCDSHHKFGRKHGHAPWQCQKDGKFREIKRRAYQIASCLYGLVTFFPVRPCNE
jgi:hypothetical protein